MTLQESLDEYFQEEHFKDPLVYSGNDPGLRSINKTPTLKSDKKNIISKCTQSSYFSLNRCEPDNTEAEQN